MRKLIPAAAGQHGAGGAVRAEIVDAVDGQQIPIDILRVVTVLAADGATIYEILGEPPLAPRRRFDQLARINPKRVG
jgi:hypothetical protein